jgi:hypothetical protein
LSVLDSHGDQEEAEHLGHGSKSKEEGEITIREEHVDSGNTDN